jgi:hypothetical protein
MKKFISIKQPWAWLIVAGFKDIENRDWPTSYRGELFIQAGKYRPSEDELRDIEKKFRVKIDRDALQFGGIIGKTRLIDCVRSHPSKWFFGPFGFTLADSSIVPFRPLRGMPGNIFNFS